MIELLTYESARDWLYSLKNRGSKYGIDRMIRFSEELGHPERGFPCIHVAGTNGKGSTCAMLEQVFRDQGVRTGLSTSPHLVRQGERIQVDRRILEENQILEYVRELQPVAERIGDEDPELYPSFFEFMTAMAFLHFKRSEVGVAIVEVGLGGRLDATNVLEPEISVITSIGLDHCEILGSTLEAIAREKAGIIKPGVPVVVGCLPPVAMETIRSICVERNCRLYSVEERFGPDPTVFPETSLSGGYQRINAAITLLVVEVLSNRLGLDADAAQASLRSVSWPARWEKRKMRKREVVFDVSHNSEGARWLDENLEKLVEESNDAKPDIVMGVMGEYRALSLVPVAAKWARRLTFVVPFQNRASSTDELARHVPSDFKGAVVCSTVAELFPARGECALDVETDHPLVVTGSIYLIGEIWDRYYEDSPFGQGALQDLVLPEKA